KYNAFRTAFLRTLTGCLRFPGQDLSISRQFTFSKLHSSPNLVITGGAGFIGSNLTLALQEKFPNARLTVIDDFRSGSFKNLTGYRGDFVAQNLATLDWREQFGDENFDAIFHLASITDTTLHDQFVQVHDNVESFRRLLNFARPTKTRIIYASSAATYGPATEASVESNGAAPANVYAFSKVIMDNLARRARSMNSLMFLTNVSVQIFSRITSITRMRITKTSRKPISRTRAARLVTSHDSPWRKACAITCTGCTERSAFSPHV